MLRPIFLFLLIATTLQTTIAQDSEAETLMEETKNFLQSIDPIQCRFVLHINLPERDTESQPGFFVKSGSNLRMQLEDMLIISDGTTRWTYLESLNEVQINDEDQGEMDLTDFTGFLEQFTGSSFTYLVTGNEVYKGKNVVNIEFKPNDVDSEFSKARLRILDGKSIPSAIEIFEKNGSRYELEIQFIGKFAGNIDGQFVFNKNDYPNVTIEDLRLD